MSKTVCISDLHLRHRQIDTVLGWEEPYDRLIQTGDIFDQFGDTKEQNADAARWLKAKLEDPRYVGIFGNHDWSYAWLANPNTYCSGFSDMKGFAVREILGEEDFAKLKLHHFEHNILFSHAGLDNDWFYWAARAGFETPEELTLENILVWLDRVRPQIDMLYGTGQDHPLMAAGADRGGDQKVGGIIWRDFSGHNPIPGVAQIFGHTPQDSNKGPLFRLLSKDGSPTWRYASKGINPQWLAHGWSLCMDTNSRHYLVIENDVLTVKAVKWSRPKGNDHYIVEPGEVLETIKL